LLPEAWQADVATRDLRELLRMRIALAQDCTRYKNQIHAVHLHGQYAEVSDLLGRSGRAWLQALTLRPAARQAIDTSLRLVDQLDQEVHALDQQLRQIAKEDPAARCLMSIPGIGAFTALVLKAEIGNIHRFPDKKSLCNYAGLVPVMRDSAAHQRRGGIMRAGSRQLRWVMSEAAMTRPRATRRRRAPGPAQTPARGTHRAGTKIVERRVGAVDPRSLFRRANFCGDVKGSFRQPEAALRPARTFWRFRSGSCATSFCASSTYRSVAASFAKCRRP